MKNIVLIGMPGTGKSTVGRALAERLGYDHAEAWRGLVRACLPEIARGYNIHPDHLRWYAAFHRKERRSTST